MQITHGPEEQDGHIIALNSEEMIEATLGWLRERGVTCGPWHIRVQECPEGPFIPVLSGAAVSMQVCVPHGGWIDIKTPGPPSEVYTGEARAADSSLFDDETAAARQRLVELMADNDAPTSFVIPVETYQLMMGWIDRAEELADALEDTSVFAIKRREDLRSGIQERLQCLRDLFLLTTGSTLSTGYE